MARRFRRGCAALPPVQRELVLEEIEPDADAFGEDFAYAFDMD
jgi:hypothetical protein